MPTRDRPFPPKYVVVCREGGGLTHSAVSSVPGPGHTIVDPRLEEGDELAAWYSGIIFTNVEFATEFASQMRYTHYVEVGLTTDPVKWNRGDFGLALGGTRSLHVLTHARPLSDLYSEMPLEQLIKIASQFPEVVQRIECADTQIAVAKAVPDVVRHIHDPGAGMWMALVRQNGLMLQHVPPEMQTHDLCLVAVQGDGSALRYIPYDKPHLRTPEVCIAAVKQYAYALEFVKLDAEETKEHASAICMAAAEKDGRVLRIVPAALREQFPEICLAAVRESGTALEFVPVAVQQLVPDLYMTAVHNGGFALEYVPLPSLSPELAAELCRVAVEQDGMALAYVPEEIQRNVPELCAVAVKNNGCALRCLKAVSRELQIAAVQQDGDALKYVPVETMRRWCGEPNICLEAVCQNGLALEFVPFDLQEQMPGLVAAAVRQNERAWQYVARGRQARPARSDM